MKRKFYSLLLFLVIIFYKDNLKSRELSSNSNKDSQIKIGYWSSWKIRCGIAQYTEHLYNALIEKGYSVRVYSNKMPIEELTNKLISDGIQIFNIQYEPAIMPTKEILLKFVEELKKKDIKIILTVHNEVPADHIKKLVALVDHCIYHKNSIFFKISNRIHFIPMGVPVFNPVNWLQLRKKYNFDQKNKILTTIGFLSSWKNFSLTLEKLVPWLKENENNHIQLLTSYSDVCYEKSVEEDKKIKNVIEKYSIQNQVTHITDYISQEELDERLFISDLGYLWGTINSKGSSAAGREFISSRLPSIITESTHYEGLINGVIKTPKQMNLFVKQIINVINDTKLLKSLRSELVIEYQKFNYSNLIKKHISIFNQCVTKS